MSNGTTHIPTETLQQRIFQSLPWLGLPLLVALLIEKMGLVGGAALLGILPAILFGKLLLKKPIWIVWCLIALGYFSAGLARYVAAPWGLMVDGLLVLGWSIFLVQWRKTDWKRLDNSLFWWSLAWFGMVVLQLVNPQNIGPAAWFYAMRAMGFYQVLCIGFMLLLVKDIKVYDQTIRWAFWISVLGTLWGLKQQNIGLDAVEYKWLYVDGNAMTHVLAGVLRVFSFYSDAGQFGASQAMICTMAGILFLGPFSKKEKAFFLFVAIMSLIGFGISGTRGSLAVPAAGGIVYLIISKNVKVLSLGAIAGSIVFYILKYTFVLQHVEQIRRMRTALDPNDPSLLVRYANQQIFANYLANKPFGGGIGCVGFWGNRFRPGSFLATMPTDSYFVKVWVEMGVVGVGFHLLVLGFIIGRAGAIIWNLQDARLRQYCAAMFAAFCGVLLASYGNQVFVQVPTSLLLFVFLPLIFLAPKFDKKILESQRLSTDASRVGDSDELKKSLYPSFS